MSWVRAPHWVLRPFLHGFSLATLLVCLALFTFQKVRIGPVVRIPRFHRGGRGSIPRCGGFVFVLQAPVCGVFLSNTHTDLCKLCLYPLFNLFCCRDSLFSLFPAFTHQLVPFLSMKWQKKIAEFISNRHSVWVNDTWGELCIQCPHTIKSFELIHNLWAVVCQRKNGRCVCVCVCLHIDCIQWFDPLNHSKIWHCEGFRCISCVVFTMFGPKSILFLVLCENMQMESVLLLTNMHPDLFFCFHMAHITWSSEKKREKKINRGRMMLLDWMVKRNF